MQIVGDRLLMQRRFGTVLGMAKSKTARNSMILFGGNLVSALLSMVAVIFMSRSLGPAGFGVIGVYNAVNAVLIGITNFGLDTAAIKLISSHSETDRRRASVIMKAVFVMEMISGLLILVAGVFLSGPLAKSLGGEHLLFAIRMSFLASAFLSAAAFVGPFFIAYQRFVANAIVGVIGVAMRVGLILLVAVTVGLNLNNVIIVTTIAPVIYFIMGLFVAPRDWRIKTTRSEDAAAWKEVFHFSKWILLAYFATVIGGKIDVFLLTKYKGTATVGLYSAALQLNTVMPMLIGAITSVLLPAVSRLKTKPEFVTYMKKSAAGTLALVIALLPVLIFGGQIIELIFGPKYAGSLVAFQLLFAGYLVALVANPLGLVVYAMNKPKIFTMLNYIQLAIGATLNFMLIPIIGITGAALTFLIINIIGGVGGVAYAVKMVRDL